MPRTMEQGGQADCDLEQELRASVVRMKLEAADRSPSKKEEEKAEVRGACDRAKSARHAAKIRGQGAIPPRNEVVMKKAVAGQPIAVAIEVGSGMQFYKSGVYSGPCGTRLAHAVTVVGYGTDHSTKVKYWIVKNSWGRAWGEGGFVRMRRDVGGPGICGITLDVAYPY